MSKKLSDEVTGLLIVLGLIVGVIAWLYNTFPILFWFVVIILALFFLLVLIGHFSTEAKPSTTVTTRKKRSGESPTKSAGSQSSASAGDPWLAHCIEIENAWTRGDYDWARMQLQKIAYGMVGDAVTDAQRADFTRLMTAFAKEDPLYRDVMARVLPLVQANPGMLQSQIYKGQPDHIKEQMRYVLYFANELGHIKRIKKGNSYKLMLPDTPRTTTKEEQVMKNMELMNKYVERALGHPLDQERPDKLNGNQVSEILWPLNDVFRPNQAAIQSLPYEVKYELEADAAIADYAFNQKNDLSKLSSGAWRVFMERHYQTLMLAGLQLETPFLSVPINLPKQARLGFLLLFQYHEMKLPFPVQDRSNAELHRANAPGNLLRH